jgi:hypothetical protein
MTLPHPTTTDIEAQSLHQTPGTTATTTSPAFPTTHTRRLLLTTIIAAYIALSYLAYLELKESEWLVLFAWIMI